MTTGVHLEADGLVFLELIGRHNQAWAQVLGAPAHSLRDDGKVDGAFADIPSQQCAMQSSSSTKAQSTGRRPHPIVMPAAMPKRRAS